jgi:hypothetical protein
MVMFKAKFKPLVAGSLLQAQQQQQPQARPRRTGVQQQQQPQPQPPPQVPPIEEERGPQVPIREPEPLHEPERALELEAGR